MTPVILRLGEGGDLARRAVQRLHVGNQLNQIARDETRREAAMTQQLREQPRRVAGTSPSPSATFPRVFVRPAPGGSDT